MISNNYIDNPLSMELVQDLKEEDSHSLMCPLCYGLIRTPYLVCNGCKFFGCSDCLIRWSKEGLKKCPQKCHKHIEFQQKQLDKVQSLLDHIKVKCPYSMNSDQDEQCDKIQKYSEICNHMQECEYALIPCPQKEMGCSEFGIRKKINEHNNLCKQMKKCRWCVTYIKPDKWIVDSNLTHEDQCEFRQQECENQQFGCKLKPQLKKLISHQNECKFRQVQCKYCQKYVMILQLDKHQDKCIKTCVKCQICGQKIAKKCQDEHQKMCAQKKCEIIELKTEKLLEDCN